MLTRRDTLSPEGGGAEIYLETIAKGLVAQGHSVTIFCGAHKNGGELDDFDGVKIVRRGSNTGVHREALRAVRRGDLGSPDVIVDVQNGMPFFSGLVARNTPCIVLVHHVHREQWPVVYGPIRARIGWFIESQVAPRFYRKTQYVAVSEDTKAELTELGVAAGSIEVIHNGTFDLPREATSVAPGPIKSQAESESVSLEQSGPRILVLGRLVPHKQVEHVFAASANLRQQYPGLTIAVVGDGWWSEQLIVAARKYKVDDIVDFTGFVSEERKHQELSRATVLALPSLKEGWGIVIMEAARHGVPAVGYRDAGGVAESISHGESGLLVDGGVEDFQEALRTVLSDPDLRRSLGEGAQVRSHEYSWDQAIERFEELLRQTVGKTIGRN